MVSLAAAAMHARNAVALRYPIATRWPFDDEQLAR